MKTIKVELDNGDIKTIKLKNAVDVRELKMELSGYLPYIREYETTKGEIISSSQIAFIV